MAGFHELYGPLYGLVKFLDDLIIGIHAPYKAGYGSLKLGLENGQAILILRFVKLHFLVACLVQEHLHDIITYLKSAVILFKSLVAALQHAAVALGVLHRCIQHHVLGSHVTIVLVGARGIQRHEYIWHYSAAAIYGAMLYPGTELE